MDTQSAEQDQWVAVFRDATARYHQAAAHSARRREAVRALRTSLSIRKVATLLGVSPALVQKLERTQ